MVTGSKKDSTFLETVMILIPSYSRSFIGTAASVLAITVCYAAAGAEYSSDSAASSPIANATKGRLSERVNEAMLSLERGREAYRTGDFVKALEEYQSSMDQMPDVPATANKRAFIAESIADASVAVAQQYMKVGKYDDARKLLEDALTVKPDSKLAKLSLEMMSDPVRLNPAKSPQQATNVTEVERLLAMGYGFFDLGQYDDATKSFESVLRIDPYNSSARRGMEQVSRRTADYYNTARNQSRGKALAEVESKWEQAVPPDSAVDMDGAVSSPVETGVRTIEDKLSSIILPRVDLQDIDILEAVDFLRNQSISLDSGAPVESERGVNITVNLGDPTSEIAHKILSKRFNLKLSHVPLKDALQYVSRVTGTVIRPNMYTVEVTPASEDSSYLMTKVIPVPPGFLSGMGGGAGGASEEAADPFAEPAESGSLVIKRVDPQEALKTVGISFPEGAVARYNADSSSLFVRNTPKNIQAIEDFVTLKASEQPCQVVVQATFIEVNEKRLKELGFDWILNGNLDASKLFGSGGGDKSNPLNQGIYDGVATVAGHALPTGAVTGGLRSLNQVAATDSIDALIQNGSRSGSSTPYELGKGPSFFTFRGTWNSLDMAVVMRGLDQKTGVDVLQKPALIVRPGEKATFFAGREMPYPEEYEAPQLPTNANNNNNNNNGGRGGSSSSPVTPSTPTSFSTRNIGTSFDVEVKGLSEDKSIIDLSVVPSVVDFDGFVNYGTPIMVPVIDYSKSDGIMRTGEISSVELTPNQILKPIFTKKEATTSLNIATGKTIVLAGLKKAKNVAYEDKVPILGDVPWVGRLFRSEGTHVERKVIIIMLKANVIDPLGKDIFTHATPDAMPDGEQNELPSLDAGLPE